MSKRIYNFSEFVNESYINEGFFSELGKKISNWAKNLYNSVKSGIIKLISSGPKAGTPRVALFSGGKGDSILGQVNNFYKNTDYYNMNNLMKPETLEESFLYEDAVPLKYPVPDDVPDYSEEEIKKTIKRNLKEIFTIADEMDAAKDSGASNLEIKDIYRGILDVKPIFIYGAPGIGKTQIVAQVCDELGQELYGDALNLLNVDGENAEPVDFAGVPSVVTMEEPDPSKNFPGRGVTRSNINIDILPYDNGENGLGGIIFIDELNRMPQEVIKIFMKLAQSRRVGNNYNIPNRWYIVAAGNRKIDDPREVAELGTALRDRFEAINFLPTVKGFRKYIEGSRYKKIVLPELLDFLEFQKNYFHNLDPDLKKTKYATPRAWVDASLSLKRAIKELEEKGITQIPEDVIKKEFSKNVGNDATVAFLNFYKVAKDIPIKDLGLPYTDPSRAPILKPGDSPDFRYALMSAVVRKSTEMNMDVTSVCNFCKWLERMADVPEEGMANLTNFCNMNPEILTNEDMIMCIGPLVSAWGKTLGDLKK